jgi:hypothetical protein
MTQDQSEPKMVHDAINILSANGWKRSIYKVLLCPAAHAGARRPVMRIVTTAKAQDPRSELNAAERLAVRPVARLPIMDSPVEASVDDVPEPLTGTVRTVWCSIGRRPTSGMPPGSHFCGRSRLGGKDTWPTPRDYYLVIDTRRIIDPSDRREDCNLGRAMP